MACIETDRRRIKNQINAFTSLRRCRLKQRTTYVSNLCVVHLGLFSIKEIYIVSKTRNPNNSKYGQVSPDIISLLLANATDNVYDRWRRLALKL